MSDLIVSYSPANDRYYVKNGTVTEEVGPLTRQYIEDLVAERDTLRRQLTDVVITNGRLEERCAKLRNLAHILCHCMQIHAECDDCRLNGAKGEIAFDPLCACDGLHELLREAGIEVS